MEIPPKEKCFYFGKVIRTHGYKGGLKVVLDVDDPPKYAKLELIFVELKKKLVPYFIENIQFEKNKANLKFEDINTIEQAERFLQASLYLPLDLLPKLKGNKFYYHEVTGFTVTDVQYGEIGTILKIIELPGNPLFSVDYDGTEILIPVTDEIILKVDRRSKSIHIKAPQGLIELYKP